MITLKKPIQIPEQRLSEIKVYEMADIKKLPQILDYRLDMIDDNEIFKRKEKPALFGDFITFDIESSTLPERTRYNADDLPLAFPYLYQWHIFGTTWIARTEKECLLFFMCLANWARSHELAIPVYVHNLSFEYEFLRSIIPIDTDSIFAMQSRRILRFEAFDGNLEFRCSMLLSNMSLEKFTENYCSEEYRKDKELIDYEITRWSWTELTEEVLYYSAMDVITLYHSIFELMRKENDTIKTIPMTNTGYVRRSCRVACLGENSKHYKTANQKKTYARYKSYRNMFQKTQLSKEQYELLVLAYRGGNTHANRFLAGQIIDDSNYGKVGSVDFASSYPAVLICSDEFPMGRLIDCTEDCQSIENFEWFCRRYWVVADVVFENLELRNPYETVCPYVPDAKVIADRQTKKAGIYDNGRVIKMPGFCSFAFLGCEWEIIKKQYKGRMRIKKAFYTPKGYLPLPLRRACFEWYDAKTRLKNVSGSEYEYMKSKNRVNSVYGLMVERIIKNIIEWSDKEKNLVERRPTEKEAQEQIEDFYNPRNQKFVAYQWGVTITALARIRHMDVISLAGSDFVYGDTDSVKMINFEKHLPEIEKYNETWKKYISQCGCEYESYTVENEYQCLGLADFEGIYDRFVTLGAKKYAYEQKGKLHITIAGVPKKAGALMLGKIENFRPGFVFEVPDDGTLEARQNWKKKLTYRDDTNLDIEVDGHVQHIGSGIAIQRTTYNLDITDEYRMLTGYTDMYIQDDFI